jgi:sugar O-acyltransferase (sialic acid O-acetyltransferase NeuD family)
MASKDKFILWGSSGHAKVLSDLIQEQNGEVVALFDNSNRAMSIVENVPIWYGEKQFREWVLCQEDLRDVSAAVAIGGARGQDRLDICKLFREQGLRLPNLKHNRAYVAPSVIIGESNQFLANSTVAAHVQIGNSCIINHNASVDHECVLGDGVHVAPGATLCGCIAVGDFAMIGAGAVVLPNVKIGCRAIIGAGAVVTKNIPESSVVAGSPARILTRTMNHREI